MIAHFPAPYPGELLFSLCSRYNERVQYPSQADINLELFGGKNRVRVTGFQWDLGYLIANLPAGHQFTLHRLIYDHTLAPFYFPFFQERHIKRLIDYMKGMHTSGAHRYPVILTRGTRSPIFPRFCPLCVDEDKKQYGEGYWHRLHQVPGVKVCPKHYVLLDDSSPYGGSERLRRYSMYISANQISFPIATARQLNLHDKDHQALINVARDADWLLRQRDLTPDFRTLHERYMVILNAHGLVGLRGEIRQARLVELFHKHFSSDLLQELKLTSDTKQRHQWLSVFIEMLRSNQVQHPLKHLLFLQLFGYTAEAFFGGFADEDVSPLSLPEPFGKGPWPCLNKACVYFKVPQIRDYQLKRRGTEEMPIGTFRCSCGFTYARKGPDASPDDPYRYDWVKQYGALWESLLRDLWKDPSTSIREIGRRLGVTHSRVVYHAIRLKLNFFRHGSERKSVTINPVTKSRVAKAQSNKLKRLKSHRKKWLAALRKHPGESRSFFQQEPFTHTYRWLRDNDRAWLIEHLPALSLNKGISLIDWGERDAELSAEILSCSPHLKTTSRKPIRVTKVAVLRAIERSEALFSRKNLARLPLTSHALSKVLETREEYALRLLQWAVDYCIKQSILPSQSAFVSLAGTRKTYYLAPHVKSAFDSTWLDLPRLVREGVVQAA
jgi:hypothetical protein